jgi:gliding motility-associated-like protein
MLKNILFISMLLLSSILKAASPTWTVNPASFQYSMSVFAVVEINCIELTNPSIKLGAFVGNDLRGTALTNNVNNNRYVASLIVYSNVANGETVTFKFYNPSNDSIYSVNSVLAFQEDAYYGSSLTPTTFRNNSMPTALALSNSSVNEGLAANTVVGSFLTTDPDAGETFTYSLVSGTGSTNNVSFNILGGNLRTSSVFNFTTKSSYNIRVRSTDANGCYTEQTFTIGVIDVNTSPTQIYISDSTINENSSALTVIGNLTALDQDAGETFSYSLVSGAGSTDNSSFNIQGSSLRSLAPFNFEVKSSYSIRIRVTDGANNTFERPITILVKDINDAPTNVMLNGNSTGVSFAENKPLGSLVATISTTDEDASNTFIYSFVNIAGNNNSDFIIVGNQLRTNNMFDYETRQNYAVFVQTNDGNGGLLTKQFSLTVSDSNDAPTAMALTNRDIAENLAIRNFVGKLSTTDADALNNFTYSLVTGGGSGGNSSFLISNDSLYTNAIFDFEVTNNYSIRVNVNDGFGGSYQQNFTINIINANDAPTDLNITSNQIAENLAVNSVVGTLSTIDQDVANTFTYSLVSGVGSANNASFNISGNSLRTSATFDFETKSSYTIRLRTTDNMGGFYEKSITINITDANDPPTNILLTADSINENQPINTLIGTLSSVTQDVANTFTYSFDNSTAGNNNSSFLIVGNQLRTGASFDYETKNTYLVYINTNDGNGGTLTKQFQINVKNVNDAPVDILISNSSISENRLGEAFVGKLSTIDADNDPSYTYTLAAGLGNTDNNKFTVRQDSLFANTMFDFETKSAYTIRIQTSDNKGGTYQEIFPITVLNANDTPTNILLSENTINENLAGNSSIGNFSTTDQDTGSTFTYTLVSGTASTDNGNFVIAGNVLRSSASFDFETKNSYSVRIRTTDNLGLWYEKAFTILINNVNDAPTNITLSNDTIVENRAINSLVGSFSTTDQDVANTFTYSFANIAGNSNSLFVLTGNQLRTTSLFNYEAQKTFFVYIQTNDGNGGTFTKQFQINVKDSNDAPVDLSLSTPSITENKPIGSYIGQFSTSDPDQNNTFIYSLVSGTGATNNNSFSIRNDSLFSAAVLNFEIQNSYTIRVRTTDNGLLSFEKSFTITVNDSNDFPTAITLSTSAVSENVPLGTTVGALGTVDTDAGQTFTYSLVNGAGSSGNNLFAIQNGLLKTNAIFNFEQQRRYTVRIQTNDGNGGTFTDTFNIAILNTNDAPTNIALSNNIISENRNIGSSIGFFSTTDEDSASTFTYSFANIGTNDNTSFIINGSEIKTNASFNYEAKALYVVQVQTNDGNGGTFTKQFLINIADSNDAPTDIVLNNNTIVENMPVRSFVTKLNTTDIDVPAGIFTYTLVSGVGATHNANFLISNDTLYSNTVFNFEVLSQLNIRVRSTDNGGLTTEKTFAINVLDANDAPTALALSNNTVNENVALRTRIGVLSSTDADANNTFTYSLVSGAGSTDNSSFIVQGNELKTNSFLNFEVKKTFTVRIQTNDNNGGTFEQIFTINVADSNDAPTNISLSNNIFPENRPISSVIGNLSTTDEDPSDLFTYSFVNVLGNDNGAFFINGNQIRSFANFDYETKRVYNIYVQSTDGNAVTTKQFVINITDSNDAPTNLMMTANTVNENALINTFVGVLYNQDADAVDNFTYSFVNGIGSTNNSQFRISNDSLYSNAVFDFETKASYSVRLKVTDSGLLSFEKQFEIVINNANDAPTNITLSNADIVENKLSRTIVGLLSTTDEDANTFNYSLVTGVGSADNASFIIQGNELKSNRSFNYEQQNQFNIRIQTTDGNGGLFEKAFVINIIDSNDAPTNIVLSNTLIAENAFIGSKIADISTIDQDAGDAFNYSFVNIGGNQNSNFIIVGSELRTNTVFDYETKNFYLIYLQSTDATGASVTKQFMINIKDSSDAPTAMDLSFKTVAENLAVGTTVGNFTATDADQFGNFNYTLVGGAGSNDNAQFTITGDTLKTNAVFNYEVKKSYTIRVRVTDVTNTFYEKQFTIGIDDANDAPTAFNINNTTLNENAPLGTEVGLFTTADADVNDVHTYSLVTGTGSTDNARFIIDGNKLLSNVVANYETKNSYSVRVRTTDLSGDFIENSYTVSIVDISERPTILKQTFAVSESDTVGYVFGTVTATSPDAGATLRYSIAETQNTFAINAVTGEISPLVKLDYEKQSVYKFKIVVTDAQTSPLYDTAELVINVKDVIEVKQPLPVNNYLSPNNDGYNDFFVIDNVSLYADYSLTIFNESGLVVFKVSSNYQNNWDATYEGNTLATGVYYYVFSNGKTGDTFKGAINIIK